MCFLALPTKTSNLYILCNVNSNDNNDDDDDDGNDGDDEDGVSGVDVGR